MTDTKEKILLTALRLFAGDGYEAVSVGALAAALGVTKGALYKHYKNKRDIFDSILRRMEERDAAQAGAYDLPDGTPEQTPEACGAASIADIVAFSKTMFRYWTGDEFAASFRRMLTIEQYRSAEMGALYQQYLAAGPLDYVTGLFAALNIPHPKERAAAFYGPMFLLYSVYDGAEDKKAALSLADEALERAGKELERIRAHHGE